MIYFCIFGLRRNSSLDGLSSINAQYLLGDFYFCDDKDSIAASGRDLESGV